MTANANSKKHVVIGLGKTGWSCARFLRSRGMAFVMMDTRAHPPQILEFQHEFTGVEVLCGELDARVLCEAAEIIVSPGVSVQEPALQHAGQTGVALIGDIEWFARTTKKPIIAITGSNAKSTVTTLVGEMAVSCGFRVGVGGNLGTPVLDMLQCDAETDCYVLELSSFQLETTHNLQAEVAAILNVSEDHMDRYACLQDYIIAKHRIYRNAKHVVYNRADLLTNPVDDMSSCSSFGLDAGALAGIGVINIAQESWLVRNGAEAIMRTADIRIAGSHNISNVAAALTIAIAAGWNLQSCVEAVKKFAGLPHRCQWVAEKNAANFYNDSKGTNIGATIAAIEGFAAPEKNIILIAGGDGKGANFSALAPAVHRHVKQLVLIGRDAALIARSCADTASVFAGSMIDAVNAAAKLAAPGDVVLLSPACASFDMFKSYDDRGEQFCAAVEALS
jgi:UDP-N-acetylmuramoylalanine--D-glutamate ligase